MAASVTTRKSYMLGTTPPTLSQNVMLPPGRHLKLNNSQPNSNIDIDWSNPITRKMVLVWTPTTGLKSSSNGNLKGTLSGGNGTVSGGRWGNGIAFGQSGLQFESSDLNVSTATDQAYLVIGEPPPTGTSWNMAITTGSGSFRKWFNNYTIHRYPAGTHLMADTSVWNGEAVVFCQLAQNDSVKDFYVNGVRVNNSTSSDESSYSIVTTQLLQGESGDRSSVTYWANKTYLCVKWHRLLTTSEIASLTANPWQIFQNTNKQVWVPA